MLPPSESTTWEPAAQSEDLLFSALPVPMWVFDSKTLRFLQVNEAACDAYGYTPEEFLAMTLLDIGSIEDVPRLEGYLAGPTSDDTRLWRHRTKGGAIIDVEVSYREYPFGTRRATLAVVRDVTERLRLERKLQQSEHLRRALAENFPNGALILFDRDLRYTIADGAGLELVGLSREHLEGKTIFEAFPEETWKVLEPKYRATLQGRGSSWEMPYGGRHFLVSTHPARDELGNVFAGILMTQDITERKELEESLRKSKAGLEQQVGERTLQLKQSLAELRHTVEEREQLFSRLLRAQEDERRRIAADVHDDAIQKMAAAAMRLDMLARDLPELATRKGFTIAIDAVNVSIDRLRHLLFELHPAALETAGLEATLRLLLKEREDDPRAAKGYHVRVELTEEPPHDARTVLYRVAQEAIANAAKHSGPHSLDIRVIGERGGYLLGVTDNGCGFDPECGLRGLNEGHLGLTGMRERAEAAGGSLTVYSGPDKGTTVTCWVPGLSPASQSAR
jgi:PAS domain S-box-containing protein